MWRMSSPGTYSRCWMNSTENPWYGLLWSPTRIPSTRVRAFTPRASARATTSFFSSEATTTLLRLVRGHHVQDALDDVVGGDAFRLRREAGEEAVPQDGRRHGADVVDRHVEVALQDGVGLGGQDEVHAGARSGPPGEPLVDEIAGLGA